MTAVINKFDEKKRLKLYAERSNRPCNRIRTERRLTAKPSFCPVKNRMKIVKFIREGSVELIVMGAYGHNRLRELLLGSTTSHVIHKSPIPVLLVR